VLLEAEALQLVEMRHRLRRRIARESPAPPSRGPGDCGTRTSPSPSRRDGP
jgi:hypothetical protein